MNDFVSALSGLTDRLKNYRVSRNQMSIQSLREALKDDLPGAQRLTMHYGAGGATEIFSIDGQSVEVPVGSHPEDIAAEFSKKKLKN